MNVRVILSGFENLGEMMIHVMRSLACTPEYLRDISCHVRALALRPCLDRTAVACIACTVPTVEARAHHEATNVKVATVRALAKLEGTALAVHASALVAKLEDNDAGVRKATVEALGAMEAAALAAHAGALIARLKDPYEVLGNYPVRKAAMATLETLEAAGLLATEQQAELAAAR